MAFHHSALHFHNEAAAFARLEAALWPIGPICPRCNGTERIAAVKGARMGLRRCGPCKRQFTVTIGTVFESSHVPLNKWFQAVFLIVSGNKRLSSRHLMRILDVHYKTAWVMTHRIREAMKSGRVTPAVRLGQVVGTDEPSNSGKGDRLKHHSRVRNRVVAIAERHREVDMFPANNVNVNVFTTRCEGNASDDNALIIADAEVPKPLDQEFTSGDRSVGRSVKRGTLKFAHKLAIEDDLGLLPRFICHSTNWRVFPSRAKCEFHCQNHVGFGVLDQRSTQADLLGAVGKRLTYERTSGAFG